MKAAYRRKDTCAINTSIIFEPLAALKRSMSGINPSAIAIKTAGAPTNNPTICANFACGVIMCISIVPDIYSRKIAEDNTEVPQSSTIACMLTKKHRYNTIGSVLVETEHKHMQTIKTARSIIVLAKTFSRRKLIRRQANNMAFSFGENNGVAARLN